MAHGGRRREQHTILQPRTDYRPERRDARRCVDVAEIRHIGVHPGDAGRQGRRHVRHGAAVDLRVECEDGRDDLALSRRRRCAGRAAPRQIAWAIPAREGVALGEGLVFVGLSDARVIALNEKTGALVWNRVRRRQPAGQGAGHFRGSALRRRARVGRTERGQRLARTGRRVGSEDREAGVAILRDPGHRGEGTRDLAAEERSPGRAAAPPSGSPARPMPTSGPSTT